MNLDESDAQRRICEEYLEFLEDFLPDDHADNRDKYRHDRALAASYQRAAFEQGWLMPHWETGLGGRGLSVMDTLLVRLAAARRGAPQLAERPGTERRGPDVAPVRDERAARPLSGEAAARRRPMGSRNVRARRRI